MGMSANLHNISLTPNQSLSTLEKTTQQHQQQIVSDEVAKVVFMVILYGLSPAIGVIGVVFNTFSVIVLLKQGLHKCSNILLISMALSDICFLIGYNNIPNLIFTLYGGGRFIYSESVSFLLYILYFVNMMMDYGVGLGGFCLPVLITFERLVAVFLPMKFGQIITPARTWIAIGSLYLFWIICIGYTCFWYKFEYVWDDNLNTSVGLISKSDLFYKDFHAIPIFEEVFFSIKVPPLLTVIGCVAIIVKVKMMSRKRKKMTSSKIASTSKTTKTLLAVCIAYLCACAVLAIPTYLPKHLSAYSLTTDQPTNMAVIIYITVSLITSLNSSWNFIAYIAFNKNFRDTFKEVLRLKNTKKQ